jgi:hypothetical protein
VAAPMPLEAPVTMTTRPLIPAACSLRGGASLVVKRDANVTFLDLQLRMGLDAESRGDPAVELSRRRATRLTAGE